MRQHIASAFIAVMLAASPAWADGPTVGWEWEVGPWGWVTTDEHGVPMPHQGDHECPSLLFSTSVRSPVNNTLPLVSFTRDLSGDTSQTVEIVTGPIDHDSDADLDRILRVVQAFSEAAATCAPVGNLCLIEIDALTHAMTINPIMQAGAPGGGAITFVTGPAVAGFNTAHRRCKLAWNHSYDFTNTNTQTNVGIPLDELPTGALNQLFSGVNDNTSGWEASRRGYDAANALDLNTFHAMGMPNGLGNPHARGLFALLAYLMNADVYLTYFHAAGGNVAGGRGKNVQDVYLKTTPDVLVAHVRQLDQHAAALFDGLPARPDTEKNQLATALCVAHDAHNVALNCRAKLDQMIDLLAHPDQQRYLDFLPQIPKPIAMFNHLHHDAFVVEARRRLAPINQQGNFARLHDGTFDLASRVQVRQRLTHFHWH